MKNYLKHTSLSAQFRRFGTAGLVLSLFSSPLFAASINVAWDPSSSSNVGGYKVSWGTSSGKYTSTVDVGNKTTYTLPGLTEGTKYFVAAKAYDTTKTTESTYSNEANVTVPVTTTTSTGGTTTSTGGTTTSTGGTTTSTGGTTTSGTGTATSNGLVAAYGFEESSGTTVTDASGKGNNGTIKEAVRITSGKFGNALKFDGINDWVTVNDSASLALSTGMTLEAWVYPTAMTDNATVILKEANNAEVYALYADEDASLPVSYINNGSYRAVTGPNKLPVNQWSHLVSTYDGQYQRLYVNGTEVAKSAQSGQIQQSNSVLRIGGNSVWGEYFNGYIDEVRIYNRALTATEVSNNLTTAVSAPTSTSTGGTTTPTGDTTTPTGDTTTPTGDTTTSTGGATTPTSDATTSTGGTTTTTGDTTTSTGGATTSTGTTSASNNGLVAAYGFEESSGTTVTDASGNSNNGTIKEAVRINTGKYGKALKFDGINDWVTVNDSASLDLSTGMTLEAWVYPTAMTDNATVILKEANNAEVYALYADEDASLPVSYINNGSYRAVTGPNKLPVNQWSHLVSTYDGQYQRLYVNGTEVAKSAQSGQIQQSNSVLRIGGNSVWGEFFNGYIDEVRVYNRALTATEVNNNLKTAVSVHL